MGVVLSQLDDAGTLHLVAYYSWKFSVPEINYPVYDKELAAIISSFTEWRPYLAGAQHHIQVVIDHKIRLYFTTNHTLNRRQTRWSTFLTEYDLKLFSNQDCNMARWMPSHGVRISNFAHRMMHGLSNCVACRDQINYKCSQPACCWMIHCLAR